MRSREVQKGETKAKMYLLQGIHTKLTSHTCPAVRVGKVNHIRVVIQDSPELLHVTISSVGEELLSN